MINSNFSGRKLIGSGGELYVASLFGGLTIINNGNNMPDLKSRKGQFTKPLLLEVKAGKGREGISVNYQLHYSIRTRSDFDTVLGSHLRDDAIRSFDPEDAPSLMYYSFPRRIDCVAGNDFNHSFTSLLLEWGDQYLVPGRFVFYNFAARLAMSEKIGLLSALDQVEDLTRGSIVGFRENTGEYNRWGRVRLSDVNAIRK
jgi:hypothetical protein